MSFHLWPGYAFSQQPMGAAWQRPTVGDFVLVAGERPFPRRWGQLFADDGEQVGGEQLGFGDNLLDGSNGSLML